METSDLLQVECQEDTVIITPAMNLAELLYPDLEVAAEEVLRLLDTGDVKNVVIDFHRTDYYGSTALSMFVRLWKRVRSLGGHMAFCNVSEHEREILEVTKLDGLWSICGSRDEALNAVKQSL